MTMATTTTMTTPLCARVIAVLLAGYGLQYVAAAAAAADHQRAGDDPGGRTLRRGVWAVRPVWQRHHSK